MKTELKGLKPGFTITDIENFLRQNWAHIKEKQAYGECNLDYTDGQKDTCREMIDEYFGGL